MKLQDHQKNIGSTALNARKKAKNDIILTVAILAFIAVAALALSLFQTQGDTVVVLLDGKQWGEYPLNEDRVIEVNVDGNYNIVVIENGTAYVQRASCPDGICAAHRPISYNGESIICRPNLVVVEVHTKNKTQPDIIV